MANTDKEQEGITSMIEARHKYMILRMFQGHATFFGPLFKSGLLSIKP